MGGVVVPVAAVAVAVAVAAVGDTRLRERDRHCSLVARRGWGSSRMLGALHPVLQPDLSASRGECHPEVERIAEGEKLVGRRLYWHIRDGQESDKGGERTSSMSRQALFHHTVEDGAGTYESFVH